MNIQKKNAVDPNILRTAQLQGGRSHRGQIDGGRKRDVDERDVLDTFLPRGSGSLAHMAEGLAAAGVNVDSLYLLHSNAEGFHIAMTVDDTDEGLSALAG